ncbi:sulfite reductase [Gammaproteobacteria bacterium 45_16_T64]|nr:sulfite reductase [Gammaproteobacteria bacterium 45_16_T64]
MYAYKEYDQQLLDERVEQYRDQTQRFFKGELSEEEFLILRLQNGLYVQRHAPLLRVAVPYGMLNSNQVRKMAHIARTYDKGYAHISTRQNVQFNWPEMANVPDILAELASVQMHAVQTSGNCIRNTTTDQYAGVTANEVTDPRPYCEIIRQWSTFHPEFAYLPRKFKIAVTAATDEDRAAIRFNDVGLRLVKNDKDEIGFEVFVGGGLGRTPLAGSLIQEFLEPKHLLSYLEAVLRVYNLYGRRDNKYKARIKILVKALTPEVFRDKVAVEWERIKDGALDLPDAEIEAMQSCFPDPDYEILENNPASLVEAKSNSSAFSIWLRQNTAAHKKAGYQIVTLSLKPTSVAPGDVTDDQLDAIADLADRYSFGEVRNTHAQNIVLADVKQTELLALWEELKSLNFANANINTITDIICCPGGDFCALANAKSLPVAEQIQREFDDLDFVYDIGDISLNISGCMNACSHHHIGNIGVLGVDKKGLEFYQISLGGDAGFGASVGKIIGPSFKEAEVASVISKIINIYIENRIEGETFLMTYQRIGMSPFKEKVYAKNN